MTANQGVTRSELVRKRRKQSVTRIASPSPSWSYRPGKAKAPKKSRVIGRAAQSHRSPMKSNRKHLDINFSTSKVSIQTPGITLPTIGPRLVSGITVAVFGFLFLTFMNSTPFQITGAQVTGNLRISEDAIDSALLVIGEPIFKAVPDQVTQNLLTVFPDIATIDVKLAFPNRVIVNLTERNPILLWQRPDGSSDWIDAQGVKFSVNGIVENLVTVSAYGEPPAPIMNPIDPTVIDVSIPSPYVDPSMVKAILNLAAIAPQGSVITYDPAYGFGWNDPRGWLVYFGENTQDVSMKLTIYQAIVNKLTQDGIQPRMISVEFLDAPFYRTQ
jgi:cell division protein FtsQ